MRSLVSGAGSYSKVELHASCLWIVIDHTYYSIPGIMGSHELHRTVFRAYMTWTISFSFNMRSLVDVAGSYSNVELYTLCLWIAVYHTYNLISGLLASHELLCTVFRANIISILDKSEYETKRIAWSLLKRGSL
mgnify:CR=1 FL=1